MKLSSAFILTILMAFLFITGCKEKAAKDLVVKKWKFTEISGPDAAQIPDSMKQEMYKTATMEFKKDGTWEQAGISKDNAQKGTYSLSDDGKLLISKREGSETADTVMILELTESKMVVTPKIKNDGNNVQLTMKAN